MALVLDGNSEHVVNLWQKNIIFVTYVDLNKCHKQIKYPNSTYNISDSSKGPSSEIQISKTYCEIMDENLI